MDSSKKRKRPSLDLLDVDLEEEINKRLKADGEAKKDGASAEADASPSVEVLATNAIIEPTSAKVMSNAAPEVPIPSADPIQQEPEGEKENESSPPHSEDMQPTVAAGEGDSFHGNFEELHGAEAEAEEEVQNEPPPKFYDTDQFIAGPSSDEVHMGELQIEETAADLEDQTHKEVNLSPIQKSFQSFRSSEMGFVPNTLVPERVRNLFADALEDAVNPFNSLLDVPMPHRAKAWAQQTVALDGIPSEAVENPHLRSQRLLMEVVQSQSLATEMHEELQASYAVKESELKTVKAKSW
ncbi:uncharacterized protein LOC110713212 [Chenopodium quinoa]|uniref:uncharacterized protein LOC110713212 n=1 Tax=Chenopodium quinoa TaxID=63459 RepID=UPI000B76D486|nr:uncharacterized protein LOC110713212 [Chenopodium quinoa]